MNSDDDPLVSAQVVLKPASGKLRQNTSITSENIGELAPPPDNARLVHEAFLAAGFDVGLLVGNSFSISAPFSVFEKVFKAKLRYRRHSSVTSVQGTESGSYELPLTALPRNLTDKIQVVTFSPPPDFGPTRFGP